MEFYSSQSMEMVRAVGSTGLNSVYVIEPDESTFGINLWMTPSSGYCVQIPRLKEQFGVMAPTMTRRIESLFIGEMATSNSGIFRLTDLFDCESYGVIKHDWKIHSDVRSRFIQIEDEVNYYFKKLKQSKMVLFTQFLHIIEPYMIVYIRKIDMMVKKWTIDTLHLTGSFIDWERQSYIVSDGWIRRQVHGILYHPTKQSIVDINDGCLYLSTFCKVCVESLHNIVSSDNENIYTAYPFEINHSRNVKCFCKPALGLDDPVSWVWWPRDQVIAHRAKHWRVLFNESAHIDLEDNDVYVHIWQEHHGHVHYSPNYIKFKIPCIEVEFSVLEMKIGDLILNISKNINQKHGEWRVKNIFDLPGPPDSVLSYLSETGVDLYVALVMMVGYGIYLDLVDIGKSRQPSTIASNRIVDWARSFRFIHDRIIPILENGAFPISDFMLGKIKSQNGLIPMDTFVVLNIDFKFAKD